MIAEIAKGCLSEFDFFAPYRTIVDFNKQTGEAIDQFYVSVPGRTDAVCHEPERIIPGLLTLVKILSITRRAD